MGDFAAAGAWPGVLRRLTDGEDLSASEAAGALERVLSGEANPVQIAGFLVALRAKGETAEELVGMVGAMLATASPLELDDPASIVDIVGTGGSAALGGRAANVSTMSSIVAAAAGATVCKHGNRKASSTSGSTDLLEALGVEVELDGPGVAACVREAKLGFAFARMFHPAMRHAAPVRAELGIPTVFNLLGPLSHPAQVGRVVLGVTDPTRLELMAEALAGRGVEHAWVVHGDGLDELVLSGPSRVIEVRSAAGEGDAELRAFEVVPEDVGLQRRALGDVAVGDPSDNAQAARSVLAGEPGAVRDMVVLNTAAALVVAGVVEDLAAGVTRAAAALDGGDAARTLGELVAVSRAIVQGGAAEV